MKKSAEKRAVCETEEESSRFRPLQDRELRARDGGALLLSTSRSAETTLCLSVYTSSLSSLLSLYSLSSFNLWSFCLSLSPFKVSSSSFTLPLFANFLSALSICFSICQSSLFSKNQHKQVVYAYIQYFICKLLPLSLCWYNSTSF